MIRPQRSLGVEMGDSADRRRLGRRALTAAAATVVATASCTALALSAGAHRLVSGMGTHVAAMAEAAPSITEFPIAGSANPDQISAGLPTDPAPSVWVTDPYGGTGSNGEVYRVDTATGALSGSFAPAAGATVPTFIKPGPDGRMWTSDFNGTLMRAASDGVFEKVGPDGYAHGGLAVGPDGNVWYVSETGGANTGQVGFIDPTTLAVSDFDIPTANSHPNEITAGPPSDPNSMWFTEEFADRIGRVDTKTHVVTDYGGLTAGSRPNGIVVGSDGSLWFAEYGIGKIGRIDPITHQVTEYDVPDALGGPDRMTVAPGGRIWFTLLDGSQVGSFLPGPNPTFDLISTPTAGAGPSGITIGPDGHVWFAEYNNHAVARIDGSYSQLPSTTIDSGPSGTTTDTTATFTFHSDDPAASFECNLDGGPFTACASPDTIAGLAVGQHTFTVRALNGAGTETNPPSRAFTVTTPPPPGPPRNTGLPAINQAFDCGATLDGSCKAIPNTYDCDPGTWDGRDPSVPYSYEWQRLTPDKSYIGGYRPATVATGPRFYAQRSSLQSVAATESWQFQCVVTASSAAGSTSATSPSRQLDPAPAPPSSLNPTVDIRVTGIEVTQGAQTVCCAPGTLPRRPFEPNPTTPGVVSYQGVTLAAGKDTVVRVFAGFTRPADSSSFDGAAATLRVYDSSGTWLATLPPDTSPGSIGRDDCLCVTAAQRANPGASFNFLIPWQETFHRSLSFRATVTPRIDLGVPQQCSGCDANKFELDDVPFASTALVPVHPYQLTVGGVPTSRSELQVFGSAQTVLPNDVQIFPYAAPISVDNMNTEQAVAAVLKRAAQDGLTGNDFPIGVFIDGKATTQDGKTQLGGSTLLHKLYDKDGPVSIARDDRPLTSAMHEIGHGLGLVHADTGSNCGPYKLPNKNVTVTSCPGPHPDGTADCGGNTAGEIGESWPPDDEGRLHSAGLDIRRWSLYQQGSLPQTFVEDFSHYGFHQKGTVYYDFMSYCANTNESPLGGNFPDAWISDRNWTQLIGFHPPAQNLPAAADRSSSTTGPSLHVIATVNGSGTVSIFDVEPPPEIPGGPPIIPSPYQIELLNTQGAVLASAMPETTTVHVDGIHGQRPPLVLEADLPLRPGTAAVSVSSGRRQLARRDRSKRPPTVKLLSPPSGSRVGRSPTTTVRWIARVGDRDRVTAAVDYSPNGGRTWKVVADNLTGNHVRLPSRRLSASRNGRLRIRVSDGFDTATATSGRLQAAGAPPTVRILVPARGVNVRTDQTLLLQGAAFDDAAHPLTGRQLAWYAGKHRLGNGERITITHLPPGATTIRLVATDRQHRSSQATIHLHVLPNRPAFLIARAPARIAPTARRLKILVATNGPATLTIAGRRYHVDRRPRTITIKITPGRTTLRLRYTLAGAGGAIHQTYTLKR